MLNLRCRDEARSVEHKIGRQFFFAHLCKVRCVRAVVAAYDQQQVHRDVEQLAQCILSFLSCATNRIEETKIFLCSLKSIAIKNRLANSPLHFFSLTPEHRRLICHTDGLQMHVRVEPRRMRSFELLEERLLVATVSDVIANVISVRKC